VIAIIAILAAMLLPALSRARAKADQTACLNNCRQLISAAHVYALDNSDRWPGNGPGNAAIDLANPPANYVPNVWAEGREGSNLTDQRTADGMLSERVSLLAPYMGKMKASFRCPADRMLTSAGAARYYRPRSYGMNTFVGWESGTYHGEPSTGYLVFKKTTSMNRPAEVFVFGEIHPFSICRPQFGVHMEGASVYHIPGNQHRNGSVFDFGDGHSEAHKWMNLRFNNPSLPEGDTRWHSHEAPHPTATLTEILTDLNWLRAHATYR
jgi:hypothetical protein